MRKGLESLEKMECTMMIIKGLKQVERFWQVIGVIDNKDGIKRDWGRVA